MYSNVDIKKMGDLQSKNSASHNLRQIPSENVNTKKSHLNDFFVGSKDMDYEKIKKAKLSKFKIRKNAVKTVNLSFQASSAGLQSEKQINEWKKATFEFIEKKFGKENLIYCVCHMDEKTPHIQTEVLPVNNGKLNASHFFDGRQKCADFATDYNKAVKHLGFKRDKGREKAKPQSTNDFYQKVREAEGIDKKLDQAVFNAEKTLSSSTTLGMVRASVARDVLKPLASIIKRYKAKEIANREKLAQAKKAIEGSKKLEQKIADFELKFDNMGLSPTMKFSECVEVKNQLTEYKTAIAEREKTANSSLSKEVKAEIKKPQQVEFKIKPR
jgi:hypothetical protein